VPGSKACPASRDVDDQVARRALDSRSKRIQFTPDLLPADLIGTLIFNPAKVVHYRKGRSSHFPAPDEVNRRRSKGPVRAPGSRWQERQVTIGDTTFELDRCSCAWRRRTRSSRKDVPLPEAQVDRFMLKVAVDYPAEGRGSGRRPRRCGKRRERARVATRADILAMREVCR